MIPGLEAIEADARQLDECGVPRRSAVLALCGEVRRLTAIINTPEINSFLLAVQIEQAHQRVKWGEGHDGQKGAGEWALLMNKLQGKLAQAHWDGDRKKYLHHLVTLAAVCFHCHRLMVPIADTPAQKSPNEATVDRVAEAVMEADADYGYTWAESIESCRHIYRGLARAAIAALGTP